MASISAVSAFDSAQQQTSSKYELLATMARQSDVATSAIRVFGSVYDSLSGYNIMEVKLNDWNPQAKQIADNAYILSFPSYRATTFPYDAAHAVGGFKAKLFTSSISTLPQHIDTKYVYTGSTDKSDYGSYGPVLVRYGRHLHISGNLAYDMREAYNNPDDEPHLFELMAINVHSILPTMYDNYFYKASFSQLNHGWLDSYIESELPEELARHVVFNPSFVGTRLNTPYEIHANAPLSISKAADSYMLKITLQTYLGGGSAFLHRIGRFVFDIELTI